MITDKFDFFLFDWDGCLANTTKIWVSAYFTALKKRGRKIAFSELRKKAWGNHEQGPKNLGIVDYQECWNEVVSLAEQGLNKPPLHLHTTDLLSELKKQNKKVALVTSSYKNIISASLKNHKIQSFFDAIVTKEDVQKSKPDPEALLKALNMLLGPRDKALMIGDTETDVIAGKKALIKTALILHPANEKYHNFEELKKSGPDYIFSDFSEIYK